jgi:hypothetical protein
VAQKQGVQRRQHHVEAQFELLSRWIFNQWRNKKKLVLGADVAYLKDRYTILCISVLYDRMAIPIAWKVLVGNTEAEGHPLWLALLAQIAPSIPPSKSFALIRGL